ncbi:VWA domain-containing protein [Intrasporangium sp.]|uniref:VWA domain-containing protein n=1 Tax=Intrasporangium sp. TaxID=1925024 RepID=UPI002939E7F0|nr:VWA domain-containing protein [Intrasporangium sp.]MDV3220898.1 VWA domain-containing protein [Intrasporangium sp.]
MTLLPIAPAWVLAVLGVSAVVAIWWHPRPSGSGESAGGHWRLTAAVVLLGVAALRPGVPGDEVEATATNLNVYFVVDTTSSIIAEDWGGENPRVAGVRGDVADLALALSGARYSIVTFDQVARVRLPLTTDTTALDAALATLLPEPAEYSRGSSVTVADERLGTLLQQAAERHPERGRIVFYLGDGEQTAEGEPPPFTIPSELIHGGAVLGYGTSEGGRMKSTRARYDESASYLQDPTTGADAVSVIDEDRLRQLAGQLGLPYHHRVAGESVLPVVDGIDLARYGSTEELERERVRARRELYWPLLLGVAGIAAWELGAGLAGLSQTRRRRPGTS